MRLYHFTCGHFAPAIRADGMLRPQPHPMLGMALVWLTDSPRAARDALGLTSHMLDCDRTEYRVTVESTAYVWAWAAVRDRFPRAVVEALESHSGTGMLSWFVTTQPIPVLTVEKSPRTAHAAAV